MKYGPKSPNGVDPLTASLRRRQVPVHFSAQEVFRLKWWIVHKERMLLHCVTRSGHLCVSRGAQWCALDPVHQNSSTPALRTEDHSLRDNAHFTTLATSRSIFSCCCFGCWCSSTRPVLHSLRTTSRALRPRGRTPYANFAHQVFSVVP